MGRALEGWPDRDDRLHVPRRAHRLRRRAGGTEHGPAKSARSGWPTSAARTRATWTCASAARCADPVTGILGSARRVDDDRGDPAGDGGGAHVRRTAVPGRRLLHRAAWALAAARDVLGRARRWRTSTGTLDLSDGVTSPTGEAADMPLSVALGRGPRGVGRRSAAARRRASRTSCRSASAIRTRCRRSSRSRPSSGPRSVPSRRTRCQAEGPAAVGERVAADLARARRPVLDAPDVDILGEDEFPATDYLMPDGLDMDKLVALMRPLAGVAGAHRHVDRLLQPGEGSRRRLRACAGRRVPRDARALAPEPLPRLRDRLDVRHALAGPGGYRRRGMRP